MYSNNYFIREDYCPNTEALTNDKVSCDVYWTSNRIYSSTYYQYYVYKYVRKIIVEKKLRRVIDIGCGPGTKLSLIHKDLPYIKFFGIDQKNAIDYCKQAYSFAEWYVDDFENPDKLLKNLTGDLIICSDVIEHIINPDMLIKYLKEKICEDGYIILSTPERDLYHGKDCVRPKNIQHIREWNFVELEQYLGFHGFKIIKHFLQFPIRFGVNRIFYKEIIKRLLLRKPLRYNQVCLLQKT